MPLNQATQTGSQASREALGVQAGAQQTQQGGGGVPPVNPQQQQLQALQTQQSQTQAGGLPRGGLDSQLDSINQYYDQVRNATMQMPSSSLGGTKMKDYHIGFDPQAFEANQLGGVGQETAVGEKPGGYSSDLNSLARRLAKSYGLDVGRGEIVDEAGNLLITPDQIQAASGGAETVGSAAAKLNYLSSAITKQQNLQQQQKGIAAIQTSLGQVQKRGRGSLAAMQTGLYQDLADLYSNQEYEQADYSYFIERERMDLARELDRKAQGKQKSKSRGQFIGGALVTIAGLWSGNIGVAAQGASMVAGSAETTGWF